jgi:hypothetical protein
MSRTVSSSCSTADRTRCAASASSMRCSALQAQAGGEDPLDDVIVQVAGDPVAVLGHVAPAEQLLAGGQVQGQGGLVGEGADQGSEGGPLLPAAPR